LIVTTKSSVNVEDIEERCIHGEEKLALKVVGASREDDEMEKKRKM